MSSDKTSFLRDGKNLKDEALGTGRFPVPLVIPRPTPTEANPNLIEANLIDATIIFADTFTASTFAATIIPAAIIFADTFEDTFTASTFDDPTTAVNVNQAEQVVL